MVSLSFKSQLGLVFVLMGLISIGLNISLVMTFVDSLNLQKTMEVGYWTIMLSLTSIACVFFIALKVISASLKPLKKLKIAADVIRQGEFPQVLDKSSNMQINHAIQAFNKMAVDIQYAQVEQLETYKRLVEEKEFTEFILESIVNCVITIDLCGTVTHMNPVASGLSRKGLQVDSNNQLNYLFPFYLDGNKQQKLMFFADNCELQTDFPPFGMAFLNRVDESLMVFEYSFSAMFSHQKETIGYVLVLRDITEELELRRKLAYQATHDALTGLMNRYDFEQNLRDFLQSDLHAHSTQVLGYMDLDRFKLVNDTSGHLAGDELLRQLAFAIRQQVPALDLVARIGGDEFIVLLTETEINEAQRIFEKISETVKNHQFLWEDQAFKVGISIGCVAIKLADNDLSMIINRADTACYQAKHKGGNHIEWYKADLPETRDHHGAIRWVPKIQAAIKDNYFQLFVQPICAIASPLSHQYHYEVLIRHQADDQAPIPPNEFLPAAERYHLMNEIDQWVVSNVIKWLNKQAELHDVVHFSVNLSGQSISDPSFLDFVLQQLNMASFPLSCLCFEITETAMVSNLSHAQKLVDTLRETGCEFALDDFGTGLSSFAYMKNFPVQFIKIDGVFIKNILTDSLDAAIVKSIIDISRSMGMKTIAEYVETKEIEQRLSELGVDMGQGWALGKPFPIKELET